MRDGWEALSLTDAIEYTIGGVWGGESDTDEVEVTVVRSTEFTKRGYLNFETGVSRSIKHSQLKSRELKEGDILLEKSGGGPDQPVGRVVYVTGEIPNKFVCSNFVQLVRPNSKIVEPLLLFHIMWRWHAINRTLEFQAQTTGIRNLRTPDYLEQEIELPPLPEQKRIVDLISSVDSYIETLQQQLDSAKTSRNAVLHELLTSGGDDWVETTLGNVCDFINGDRGKNYPSAKFRQSHGIPFINAGHLDKGIVNFDSMDFISEEVFEKLGSGKVQPGDTLFCLRGSVGKFANVEDLQKGAIASSLVIIRPNSQITREFLMHYLDSDLCSSELKQSLTGAVQPNLSANNLKSFKISLPTLGKQIEIGDLLGQFNSSITAVSSLLESTRNLRSGILSDLLSGKHEIPASYDKVMGAA